MSLTVDNSSRLTGLASGLDTETIVKGLLSSSQTKLDKQSQKTTKLQWTADAYREINTMIKNFRTKSLSVLSSTNMMSKSAYSNYMINMLTTTNAVSVSASSSASPCTMEINSIEQLATAATASSQNAFTGTTYSSDTTLDDLQLASELEFDVNDQLTFSINDKTFTFTRDTTVGAMMKEINTSDAGVTMRFSNLSKGFSITSNTMGSANPIEIVNLTGNAFASTNSALGIAQGTYEGTDAICTINGIEVTQDTNSFTYDGITYTLNGTYIPDEQSPEPIKFSVVQDYQSTADSIVDFIDAYNELVDALQSKVSEEVYYSYAPLTDSQKDEMSADEIKKWEEQAKSGVLHNDSYISSLLTTLRSAFYSKVEGANLNAADIGLTTGIYSDGAKITVDKDKLMAALKEDPEAVKDMFTQTSSTDSSSEKGLMVRISDALLSYTKRTTDVALDSLESQIADSVDKEDTLTDRIQEKEESLWAKFSKMETALSQLNSMSSWLSSLFTSN